MFMYLGLVVVSLHVQGTDSNCAHLLYTGLCVQPTKLSRHPRHNIEYIHTETNECTL